MKNISNNSETTSRHYIMLKYFHLKASDEAKELLNFPYPGHSLENLKNRNLSQLELETIEYEYRLIRLQEKINKAPPLSRLTF